MRLALETQILQVDPKERNLKNGEVAYRMAHNLGQARQMETLGRMVGIPGPDPHEGCESIYL